MRRAHLITCYATASSMATSRSCVAGFSTTRYVPCRTSAPPAWISWNSHHIQHHKYHRDLFHNRIWRKPFGSKSMNFQQQLFQRSAKSEHNNVSDDTDTEEGEEEEPDDSYNYQPADDVIISQSMDWIKKIVIGYNLCPFAEGPLKEDKLKISVVRGSDPEHVAGAVIYELVSRSDEMHHGTTVVVAPEFHPDDFHQYMSLVQYIEEDVMEEHELHGLVQIAPFHPQFEFAGSGVDGIDNFTNRSPYPMFHILREDEVENAVDKLGGDASKVWSRNVKLLESMNAKWGREGAEKAMKGERMDGIDKLLKEVKLSMNDDDISEKKSPAE